MRLARGLALAMAVGMLAGCSNQATERGSPPPEPPSISPVVLATEGPGSSPTALPSALPAELLGTWLHDRGKVVLTGCAVGEECGYLQRWDDYQHCHYDLTLRAVRRGSVIVRSSMGQGMCGFNGWAGSDLRLTSLPDETIMLDILGLSGNGSIITASRHAG